MKAKMFTFMFHIIYHTAGHNQGERVGPRARDPGIQGPERDGRGSGGAMETLGKAVGWKKTQQKLMTGQQRLGL